MSDTKQAPVFKCFVIMPFSETQHTRNDITVKITPEQWKHIYEEWIKKAVESFAPHKFKCKRSPAVPGNFVKGIVKDLTESDLVIADLTGSRPNVYYELGIRHGLQTGTIMLTQHYDSVPSDLRSYYCFQYDYAPEHHAYPKHFGAFEKELHEKMQHLFDSLWASDNPVSDFTGHRNSFLEERVQKEKSELLFILETFKEAVLRQTKLGKEFLKAKSGDLQANVGVLDMFSFDLLVSRLVNTKWEMIPQNMTKHLYGFLYTVRGEFLSLQHFWDILRFQPTNDRRNTFFRAVEALVADESRREKVLDDTIKAVRELSYTIKFTPNENTPNEKKDSSD